MRSQTPRLLAHVTKGSWNPGQIVHENEILAVGKSCGLAFRWISKLDLTSVSIIDSPNCF